MAGRTPKPTALKLLTGNPGKRPLNKDEPTPDVALPEPPAHLSREAKREWRRTGAQLLALRLVTNLDRAAFAAYCQTSARWAEAETQLAKFGMVIKTPSGFIVQSPYLGIANRALELMSKFAVEFGMTPVSRSRIHVAPVQEEADPFAEFEARG